jgi:predicted NACHT family NTPase
MRQREFSKVIQIWCSVAISNDGSRVVSGSRDQSIRIWNTAGEPEGIREGHSGVVRSVTFSRDGSRVASGSDDHTVCIWNALTGDGESSRGSFESSVVRGFLERWKSTRVGFRRRVDQDLERGIRQVGESSRGTSESCSGLLE